MSPLLTTIGPSHYCEKARWALQRAGIAFEESPWLPLLHVWGVRRAGARHSTPVLTLPAEGGQPRRVIGDSTDILAWIDAHPDARWRPGLAGEVADLEAFFDTQLGAHTRRVAYHHLLPNLPQLREAADHWVGRGWQRRLFGVAVRPIRGLMRRGMRINARGAEISTGKIEAVFARVNALLADGRRFLVGDTFSAADLTFAALASPILLPAEYGAWLPPLAQVPPAFQSVVAGYRATPAGAFALRLYAEERAQRG